MPIIYFGKQSGRVNTATGNTDFTSSLWKTDGTASGTTQIIQFAAGTSDTPLGGVDDITLFNARVVFEGANRLYVSDGTTDGTSNIRFDYINGITTAFGEVLFGAVSPNSRNFSLWASDGTSGNATPIKTIFGATGTGELTDFTVFGGALYFIANFTGSNGFGGSNGVYNAQLWKSDGTPTGTALVQALSTSEVYHPSLTVSGGNLYFGGNTGLVATDPRLFKIGSGGTASLVKDISGSSVTTGSPSNLTDVYGTLFFVTNDGAHGEELWKSDGTSAGTTLVADINVGSSPSASPNNLIVLRWLRVFLGRAHRHRDGNFGSRTEPPPGPAW